MICGVLGVLYMFLVYSVRVVCFGCLLMYLYFDLFLYSNVVIKIGDLWVVGRWVLNIYVEIDQFEGN